MKTPRGSRDELDSIIARHVRAQRRIAVTRPVPAPSDGEPTDDELLAALEGRLSVAERRGLEARLEQHPYSRDRLEILREAFGEADEEANARREDSLARLVFAIRRGADQVLSFVRGSEQPMPLAPATVATRGAEAAEEGKGDSLYRFSKRFGDTQALIHVERLPGRGVDLRVELSADGSPLTDARASLRREGRLVGSVRIREGQADFADLEPSESYEMEIQREGELVGELCFSFLSV